MTTSEAQVYRGSLRATVIAVAVLAVVGAVVGWLVAEAPGVVAAEVGVGVAALSGMTTQAAMLVGHRLRSESMAALLLGSWLVKMVVIIAVVVVLQGFEDFHRALFAVFALTGIVATLAIDVWVLHRTRVSYVSPGSNKRDE